MCWNEICYSLMNRVKVYWVWEKKLRNFDFVFIQYELSAKGYELACSFFFFSIEFKWKCASKSPSPRTYAGEKRQKETTLRQSEPDRSLVSYSEYWKKLQTITLPTHLPGRKIWCALVRNVKEKAHSSITYSRVWTLHWQGKTICKIECDPSCFCALSLYFKLLNSIYFFEHTDIFAHLINKDFHAFKRLLYLIQSQHWVLKCSVSCSILTLVTVRTSSSSECAVLLHSLSLNYIRIG